MSTNIERVRYYDGEYLRSADFISEQNYHVEMRRRLNRALHLWGIVDGLELVKTEPAKDIVEVYVSPGMAIDGFGRELFLAAPWPLSATDFAQGQFTGAGDFVVWAVYRRSSETPAAAGYRLCNAKDQLTRWRESIDIVISNTVPAIVSPPSDETPPDDPKAEWPIRLGMIRAEPDATGSVPVIKAVSPPAQRTYIGLRAQHVTSPTLSLQPSHPDFNLPLEVVPNLRADKNLMIGKDVNLTATVTPTPVPVSGETFPKAVGNLTMSGDLFLQGDFYAAIPGGWLRLQEFVQNLMPEIQEPKLLVLPFVPSGQDPAVGTEIVTLTSAIIKNPSRAAVFIALTGITSKTKGELQAWWGGVSGVPLQVDVRSGPAAKVGGTDNQFKVGISWAIGPTSAAVPPLEVESLTVTYLAIFYP